MTMEDLNDLWGDFFLSLLPWFAEYGAVLLRPPVEASVPARDVLAGRRCPWGATSPRPLRRFTVSQQDPGVITAPLSSFLEPHIFGDSAK
jgi:hypothetical protein